MAFQLKLIDETLDRFAGTPSEIVEENHRLDIPRQGHVLTTVSEKYGKPIRDAVEFLAKELATSRRMMCSESLYAFVYSESENRKVRPDAEMAAWAITSIWIVGVAIQAIRGTAGLREAEQWFFGDVTEPLTKSLSVRTLAEAEEALRLYSHEVTAYHELLPYILDPHGPGSRLSVRRNPTTRIARARKRIEGVFYTPADVAEYMVKSSLDSLGGKTVPTVFDPACGTGVFLRAALKHLRRRHPEVKPAALASEYIFGTDLDPWALDASAFVLLADIYADSDIQRQKSPAELWHQLRTNLRCIDTLRLDSETSTIGIDNPAEESAQRVSIFEAFPNLKRQPNIVIGNPPYANLGNHPQIEKLGRVFRSLAERPQKNSEIYLMFVEQLTRLANLEDCACALVLPLSIACNIGPQFRATRQLIQQTRGEWRFAFFDREPHALFGEDVKTRNTILFWSRDKRQRRTILASGPLRKWRGHSRASMLNNIRFTRFSGDIRTGIPRIDGDMQADAVRILHNKWERLNHLAIRIESITLGKVLDADNQTVFVGPTAYNFLNVFLRPPEFILASDITLSQHPLHAIRCASEEEALAVFSVLTSHLAYWWWHVHGDGFHVSRRFVSEFPYGLDLLNKKVNQQLRQCGDSLWSAIRSEPTMSLNRGRTSISYSPNGHDKLRRCADEALASVAGLEDALIDDLQQFTAHTVAATLRNNSW